MANPISENLKIGTIGELLVQLRLLEYGVQAAPPLKDSGNDLVALSGYEVRTVQVKTSANNIPQIRNLPDRYHLLALVCLRGDSKMLFLDKSKIYLIPQHDVEKIQSNCAGLASYLMTQEHVTNLFAPALSA